MKTIAIEFQKETQALDTYIGGLGDAVKAYIDIHAYSQMWMYPYGSTTDLCADDNDLVRDSQTLSSNHVFINYRSFQRTLTTDVIAAIRGVHRKRYTGGPIASTICKSFHNMRVSWKPCRPVPMFIVHTFEEPEIVKCVTHQRYSATDSEVIVLAE